MTYVPPLLSVDLITFGACALGVLAALLMWRHRRHRRAIARLDALLRHERSQREQADRALAATRKHISHLSASQLSLRDAERRRIARDLHDDIGQHILALTLDVAALSVRRPDLEQPLAQFDERLHLANRSLRAIVRDLQPEALEHGLKDAVQLQVEQFSRLSGIRCRLCAEPAAFAMPPDGAVNTVLYRILQESLSNIARHAHASEIHVGISREAHCISLTVRDNGVGLPHPPARRRGGLRGIAERVAEAGGRFDIASAPGLGTALTMSLPIH